MFVGTEAMSLSNIFLEILQNLEFTYAKFLV
jgi:hypothetical protein